MNVTVAITGASGCIYGLRLARELLAKDHGLDLIVSDPGRLVMEKECGITLTGDPAGDLALLCPRLGPGPLRIHDSHDLASPLASGSALSGPMVIAPCSMGTAGRIAHGISGNLIERSADVAIKEGRRLVLLTRETPLSVIHLENMLALARAGAVILPPMPAFYHGPETVDDLVGFVVGKVLDQLGIPHQLFRRWGGIGDRGG